MPQTYGLSTAKFYDVYVRDHVAFEEPADKADFDTLLATYERIGVLGESTGYSTDEDASTTYPGLGKHVYRYKLTGNINLANLTLANETDLVTRVEGFVDVVFVETGGAEGDEVHYLNEYILNLKTTRNTGELPMGEITFEKSGKLSSLAVKTTIPAAA